jgi:hypothetical protein
VAVDRGQDWDMLKTMAAAGSLVSFVAAPGLRRDWPPPQQTCWTGQAAGWKIEAR